MIKLTLLTITLFVFTTSFSQPIKKVDFESYLQQFPGDDFICLENSIKVIITNNKLGFGQINMHKQRFLVLTGEGANQLFRGNIEFDSLIPIRNYKIRCSNLNGSTNPVKISEAYPKISTNYVFFNGESRIDYVVSNMTAGNILEISYSETPKDPHLPTLQLLGGSYPILSSSFDIEYPPDAKIEVQEYNIKTDILTKTDEIKGNRHFLHYESPSLEKEFFFEKNSPGFLEVVPHLILNVLSYEVNGLEIRVLSDLSDLEKWYSANCQNVISEQQSTELKILAHSITDSLTNELDKVKAIYYWVQENINYIAFEDGQNGYIPRLASNTFTKRYGDCKDMASLVYGLLKSVNISCNLTWIGTRDRNYTYEVTHNPLIDNHMIATYKNGNYRYILDATNKFQPITIPTSFIQGKEMLIQLRDNSFALETVDIPDAYRSYQIDSSFMVYENDIISGTSHVVFDGYEKINLHYSLLNKKSEEQKSVLIEDLFPTTVKAKILDFKTFNIDNRDLPSAVDLNWSTTYGGNNIKNKVYLNLLLNANLFSELDCSNRKSALELKHLFTKKIVTKFIIPSSYTLESLPEDFESNSKFFNLKINFNSDNTAVYATCEIVTNKLSIELQEFKELEELRKTITKQLSRALILSKND